MITVLASPLLLLASWSGAAGSTGWTDRAEYDLALTIRAEAAPGRRLDLLNQWKAKYPKTELRQVRRELFLATYQSLGDNANMLAVAREMLADQPANLVGLYWCTVLVPNVKEPAPDTLEIGEKAARGLLVSLDHAFSASSKPAAAGAPEWSQAKTKTALLAHRTLGWVAWQRGDAAAATSEFDACLSQSPNNAEISAWYGTLLALDTKQQPAALWHLARAASLRGEGALPERRQRQLAMLLDRVYTSYHGDLSGLDQLRTSSLANPLPPAGFKIETAAEMAQRKLEEEAERTNPALAVWLRMRRQIEAPDEGAKYFATLQAAPLPRLWGTLVGSSPPRRPSELVLAMRDATTVELTVKLEKPLPSEIPAGTLLEIEGATAVSYSLNPFHMIVGGSREKLTANPASYARP